MLDRARQVAVGLALFITIVGPVSVSATETLVTYSPFTDWVRPPVIGINMDVSESTHSVSYRSGDSYINAIIKAGGAPILLPAITDIASVRAQVAACDGFVMTGGRDIQPSRYGQEPHPSMNPLSPSRENYDFLLIDEILKSRKPILGVCLGAQELNVALGGSLMQDIPSQTSTTINHRQDEVRSEPSHEINFTTGTRLADALGTTTLAVNSFHHQSCDQPGKGVIITARAPDGVVEAYEVKDHPFAVGIQWHPEGMTSEPLQLRVYETLVKAANAHANKVGGVKQ